MQQVLDVALIKLPLLHALVYEHQPHILLLLLEQPPKQPYYSVVIALLFLFVLVSIINIFFIRIVVIVPTSAVSRVFVGGGLTVDGSGVQVGLRLDLVKDVPKLVFLQEFFLEELQDRENKLVEEDPLVLVKVAEEGVHLLERDNASEEAEDPV